MHLIKFVVSLHPYNLFIGSEPAPAAPEKPAEPKKEDDNHVSAIEGGAGAGVHGGAQAQGKLYLVLGGQASGGVGILGSIGGFLSGILSDL